MQTPPTYYPNMPEPPRSNNNAIKWISLSLLLGCVLLSVVVLLVGMQIASMSGGTSLRPIRMAKLDRTWARYLFEDIGVQVELPSDPRQRYHFDNPNEDDYYLGTKFYIVDSDTMAIDLQSWKYPSSSDIDLDESAQYVANNVNRDPDFKGKPNLKIEPTTFQAMRGRRITFKYIWRDEPYLFEGLVVANGATEWHFYASSLADGKNDPEKEISRFYDSLKVAKWGHAP